MRREGSAAKSTTMGFEEKMVFLRRKKNKTTVRRREETGTSFQNALDRELEVSQRGSARQRGGGNAEVRGKSGSFKLFLLVGGEACGGEENRAPSVVALD